VQQNFLMDATIDGNGYVVPMPRFISSHLGKVVFIDEQGVVRTMGRIMNDSFFQNLLQQSQATKEVTTVVDDHPSLTVAFTTGCIEVKSLTEEEVAK
jgi:hypothetical protein